MVKKSLEEILLTELHHMLEQDEKYLIDLHTYLYWKGLELCPICNEWLITRTSPEATT